MKKIIVFVHLPIVSVASFSQPVTKPAPNVKTDYLQKGMHQRHAANALLWGGAGVFLIGGTIQLHETGLINLDGKKPSLASQILLWSGIAATAGSIPLFIAYHRNKNKRIGLSFKNETAPQLLSTSFTHRSVHSLSLKISL